jgi:hypothetical protein
MPSVRKYRRATALPFCRNAPDLLHLTEVLQPIIQLIERHILESLEAADPRGYFQDPHA